MHLEPPSTTASAAATAAAIAVVADGEVVCHFCHRRRWWL